ncbi:MAG: formylglycine-generating enzyme family protein [Magnetococcales bacterium]|nr:formylglycine-generating enzyme family protein [Magnetococcales bacterium]
MRAKSPVGSPKIVGSTPKPYTNSIGMELVPIPAGSFMMGADVHFDSAAGEGELPQHVVTIQKPFYLGKYAVTQQQWVAVMGNNPSAAKGRTLPVEKVSWQDAQAFIQALNSKEGTSAYRLPTEAEWEYAARAGTNTNRYWGDGPEEIGLYAWCKHPDDSLKGARPVGQLKPNGWGLYDMLGNLHEWCQDWYSEKYYAESPSTDPKGPAEGSARVVRGGSWNDVETGIRAAYRFRLLPDSQYSNVGFRLLMTGAA